MNERVVDRHLGQCEERHKEIVRRHEEAGRAREAISQQIAGIALETRAVVTAELSGFRDRTTGTQNSQRGLIVSIAGATVLGALTLLMKVLGKI